MKNKLKKWQIKQKEKEKYQHVCGCKDRFKTARGLSLHKGKMDHWVFPKPVPKEETAHVAYSELSKGNWGQEMTKSQKRNPQRDQLMLGAMLRVAETLERLEKYIKHEE